MNKLVFLKYFTWHNVHHPKTHSVVLFTSRQVFSHSTMATDSTARRKYSPPFADSFSPFKFVTRPHPRARGQHGPINHGVHEAAADAITVAVVVVVVVVVAAVVSTAAAAAAASFAS